MLCFSHDWTGDPLSKTHLMRLLARNNRVLWVNSIGYRAPSLGNKRDLARIIQKLQATIEPVREVEKNIFAFSPLVIPSWGNNSLQTLSNWLLKWQMRRVMRKLRFRRPINWVFNPAAGVIAGTLGEDQIIYYCVDEYTAFKGVDTSALTKIERTLIDKADFVIVSAEKLLHTKRSHRVPTLLVRHGVDFHHFASALHPETTVPDEIAKLPRPVIGYFGLIADDWVDIPLLIHTARSFPTGSLVMLGKATMDVSALEREPNIHLLGRKSYGTLPGYCKGFDVAIIPFPVTEVTLNANPLKAREYLASGLPVVSTNIPEVRVLSHCLIANSPTEFVAHLNSTLSAPPTRSTVSESVRTEGWDARLSEIEHHLGNTLAAKKGSTR